MKREPLNRGERFERLTVIKFAGSRKSYTRAGTAFYKFSYLCRCDCGNRIRVQQGNLKSGNTRSCGCLHREVSSRINFSHGMSRTPTYRSWHKMLGRCFNKGDARFYTYGAREITVCERWRHSFAAFLADMGEMPAGGGYSIDRIDNNRSYCPDNCRWIRRGEQARNTTRSRWITFNGKRALITDWVRTAGIPLSTLRYRLRHWPLARALTEPRRAS